MKCPKCGSENIKTVFECSGWSIHGLGDYQQCQNCKTNINYYQQRLDNVLKHFEKNEESKYKYQWVELFSGVDITYNRFGCNQFHLWNIMTSGQMRNAKRMISLNTVESLLKDLGVME